MKENTLNLALLLGIGAVIVWLIYEGKSLFNSSAAASVGNTIYNAATGSLTTGQKNSQIAQEAQQLVAAGMSPADAQAQATEDVNNALNGAPTYWQALKDALDPFNW